MAGNLAPRKDKLRVTIEENKEFHGLLDKILRGEFFHNKKENITFHDKEKTSFFMTRKTQF